MSEHVNNVALFASGGHVWRWEAPALVAKTIGTIAVRGEARMVTSVGSRPCLICGRDGGPALLCASSTTRLLADAAVDALEKPITDLRESGASVSWTDDAGRTGTALVVADYAPQGPRAYGFDGTNHHCWQFYTARLLDLSGGPAPTEPPP